MDPSPDTRLFLDALRAAYVWTFPPARPAPSPPLIAVGPVCETSPLLAALDAAAAVPVLLYPRPDATVATVAFPTATVAFPTATVAFREQRRAATLPRLWSNSFLTAF